MLALMLALSACSSKPAPSPAASTAPTLPSPQKLWGDLKPIVSVKELMHDMIDPASDLIFDAVKVEIGPTGTVEKVPKTEKDWERIRIGAVTIAEGIYLLKIPRPFAPQGDENNSRGPAPTELSPAQIQAKLEADPVLWNAKIEALRNVGLEVLDIVKRKDADELWDAGENLDQACEGCHLQFWYPGEIEYLKKLDLKLQQLYGNMRPDRTRKFGMEPR